MPKRVTEPPKVTEPKVQNWLLTKVTERWPQIAASSAQMWGWNGLIIAGGIRILPALPIYGCLNSKKTSISICFVGRRVPIERAKQSKIRGEILEPSTLSLSQLSSAHPVPWLLDVPISARPLASRQDSSQTTESSSVIELWIWKRVKSENNEKQLGLNSLQLRYTFFGNQTWEACL